MHELVHTDDRHGYRLFASTYMKLADKSVMQKPYQS